MAVDCQEAIYSEDYQDYIIEYYEEPGESIEEKYRTSCYQIVNTRFSIIYQNRNLVVPEEENTLLLVPRCFGLLSSTQTMEETGIARVQRQPGLSLFGQGVLLGIVDTGAGV